jgi:hypothetical protein
VTWISSRSGVEHDRAAIRPHDDGWARFWGAVDASGAWSWNDRYVDDGVLDGTSWTVYLDHQGRAVSVSGSNAYPAGWDQLRAALEELAARPWE